MERAGAQCRFFEIPKQLACVAGWSAWMESFMSPRSFVFALFAAAILLWAPRVTLAGDGCTRACPCDAPVDSCTAAPLNGCHNGNGAGRGHGCCRCRKTLFHWPGGEVNYVTEDDEEEPLSTDRPDFTETSSVVGLGRTQVEFGYTFTRDTAAGIRVDEHSYPETLFRIGMLAEWFEFRIGWNYFTERTVGGGISDTFDGADDLYLGCKIALFEQDGWWPEVAITPQMTVPTGAEAFSGQQTFPGVNLLYGWDVTESFSIAGSTQVNSNIDDLGAFHEEYAQSLTTGLKFTEQLGMYHEFFGIFPHGNADPIAGPQYYYNFGFTYLVNNDFQLDWRAGWGLNDRSDDFFTGAGGAIRF
jgi:hypothetical protein